MKKSELKKLAFLGVASGLMSLCQSSANASEVNSTGQTNSTDKTSSKNNDDGNLGYHLYTEDELFLELNDKGVALYKSLDAEGKELALYVASQRCQNSNKCEGLNACQTDKNPCAGKGPCKGQGKCAIADKNLAVKIVADKMAKKRSKANKSNPE